MRTSGKQAALLASPVYTGQPRFDPWVGKIPWRRKWQSTLGLLPGKSHGQRTLVGYRPWGHKVKSFRPGVTRVWTWRGNPGTGQLEDFFNFIISLSFNNKACGISSLGKWSVCVLN